MRSCPLSEASFVKRGFGPAEGIAIVLGFAAIGLVALIFFLLVDSGRGVSPALYLSGLPMLWGIGLAYRRLKVRLGPSFTFAIGDEGITVNQSGASAITIPYEQITDIVYGYKRGSSFRNPFSVQRDLIHSFIHLTFAGKKIKLIALSVSIQDLRLRMLKVEEARPAIKTRFVPDPSLRR